MPVCPWQEQREPLALRPEEEQTSQAFDGKGHVTKKGNQRRMGQRGRRERDRPYFLRGRKLWDV